MKSRALGVFLMAGSIGVLWVSAWGNHVFGLINVNEWYSFPVFITEVVVGIGLAVAGLVAFMD